jgi:glutathione synthase/RimK-type ligase-like ATP-grasp enzyme
MQDLLVLGVPAGKRVRGLQDAARRHGGVRVRCVDYADVVRDPAAFHALAATGVPLKIDSPGDDAWVQHRLTLRGWQLASNQSAGAGAPPEPVSAGDFMPTRHWYAGFADLLRALPATAAPLAPVADILLMTDKLACQQHLHAHGVDTPPLLGAIDGYAHLLARLDEAGIDSAFIKPRFGSSAAGVVAFRRNRRGDQLAMTTMHSVAGRYVNTKRVQRYRHAGDIAALIDTLAADAAYAEAWIPKPRTAGGNYDFRVVVIDGEPQHRVARVNDAPMTNLHLDARRAAVDEVLDEAGQRALLRTARMATQAFPRSQLIGLDIVVRRDRAWVLEANAFGDLLPRLQWNGRDTYDAQLHARFPAAHADACPA